MSPVPAPPSNPTRQLPPTTPPTSIPTGPLTRDPWQSDEPRVIQTPTKPPQTSRLPERSIPHQTPPKSAGSKRSSAKVAAAAFALGGLVGAGSFGLGQRYSTTSQPVASPVINVAAPTEAQPGTTVPIPESSAPLGSEPAADVARIIGPSVVQVETNRGQGSGVVYADGLILTNHHVIDGASQVQIRTNDGRVFETTVVGSDSRNDIAVLSAPGSDLPAAKIGASANLEVGQLAVAIGSPFSLQQSVTAGIVSSLNRPVPNNGGGVSAMIQTDAPINPGNSGGALANRNGELIGINASIRTDGTSNSNVGIGFAIPIDTAIEVAQRIVTGDSLQPGVLGVTGQRQDSDIGVPIAEVTPNSGAEGAGLQAGDRVLTIDGAPVTSIGELTGLVQSNFAGDTVTLEVERGSQKLTLEATLS